MVPALNVIPLAHGLVRALIGAALVISALVGAMLAPAAQDDPSPVPYFGVIRAPGDHRPLPDSLEVAWECVTFAWAELQPDGSGDWVQAAVDPAVVTAAQSAGREVVGLIMGTPGWASETGLPNGVPRGLALPVDDPANVWAAFVRRLAEVYGPQGVTRWIVGDTPDVRPGEGRVQFAGDAADYARLLRVARAALDSVDPRMALIVGAVDGWADVAAGRGPYLARLMRALASEPGALPFEAVAVRATAGTQVIWDRLAEARAILDAAGHTDVELWLEAGLMAEEAALLGVSPARQADLIVQAALVSRAAGAARFAAYTLADSPALDAGAAWGLLDAQGAARPALSAYQQVIALTGEGILRHDAHPAADVIEARAGDRVVFAAWARGEMAAELRVTSPRLGEEADLLTPDGARRRIESGSGEYPAVFVLSLSPAERDVRGFLTVAGAPRLLVLDGAAAGDSGEFYRVVWLVVGGQYIRLR